MVVRRIAIFRFKLAHAISRCGPVRDVCGYCSPRARWGSEPGRAIEDRPYIDLKESLVSCPEQRLWCNEVAFAWRWPHVSQTSRTGSNGKAEIGGEEYLGIEEPGKT